MLNATARSIAAVQPHQWPPATRSDLIIIMIVIAGIRTMGIPSLIQCSIWETKVWAMKIRKTDTTTIFLLHSWCWIPKVWNIVGLAREWQGYDGYPKTLMSAFHVVVYWKSGQSVSGHDVDEISFGTINNRRSNTDSYPITCYCCGQQGHYANEYKRNNWKEFSGPELNSIWRF
jgi:hypothetical protein